MSVVLLRLCPYHDPPLQPEVEPRCSGSSCSTSGISRVNLVTNPVISQESGKDREVLNLNVNVTFRHNDVLYRRKYMMTDMN